MSLPSKTTAIGWIERRKCTFGLAVFFVFWFGLQQLVLHVHGYESARWWFYLEKPPGMISPGMLFMAISHDLTSFTHISANVGLLILAGSIAEPRIGMKKVFTLVIFLGYLGTGMTILVAPIFQVWIVAGASGGIFALWSYIGLTNFPKTMEILMDGISWSIQGLERLISATILLSLPVIPLFEYLVIGHVNTGHLIGIILGVIFYAWVHFDERHPPNIRVFNWPRA